MNSIQNRKESLTAYSGEQNFKIITHWISNLKMLNGKNKLDNNNTYERIPENFYLENKTKYEYLFVTTSIDLRRQSSYDWCLPSLGMNEKWLGDQLFSIIFLHARTAH